MGLYSHNVLGWRITNTVTGDFCLETLDAARGRARPVLFNTDQRGQFTATAFTGRLEKRGVAISMDGLGRALDNVYVEQLWRTVKYAGGLPTKQLRRLAGQAVAAGLL